MAEAFDKLDASETEYENLSKKILVYKSKRSVVVACDDVWTCAQAWTWGCGCRRVRRLRRRSTSNERARARERDGANAIWRRVELQ